MFNLSFETLQLIKMALDIIIGILLGLGMHILLIKVIDKEYNVYNEDGDIKLLLTVLPSTIIILIVWRIIVWMR